MTFRDCGLMSLMIMRIFKLTKPSQFKFITEHHSLVMEPAMLKGYIILINKLSTLTDEAVVEHKEFANAVAAHDEQYGENGSFDTWSDDLNKMYNREKSNKVETIFVLYLMQWLRI